MMAATEPLATELFAYDLPPELIAQTPLEPRDASRLLVLDRRSGAVTHAQFRDLPGWLRTGDLVVLNRSRVLPARLQGRRLPDGGTAELLLLKRRRRGLWDALVRPGRKLAPGSKVQLSDGTVAEILARLSGGGRLVQLVGGGMQLGKMPLPPYIRGWEGDPERYQTVYGDVLGSAAAPTAGLHFTPELLASLSSAGIRHAYVTLHVGLDTFRPVRVENLGEHEIHTEECTVPAETVRAVEAAHQRGGRVVAVGTTTVRALETAIAHQKCSEPQTWSGQTSLYILPGYRFRAIDALVTNFHLPRSTLLALVSAFAGREAILSAYQQAIAHRYRFFSFGDAMLIV
jgi:S-adenosylmethionine:tRNA ribosyltransferase-isomerase